jgi:molybdopterin-containing oxidoreductase family membrane subunit
VAIALGLFVGAYGAVRLLLEGTVVLGISNQLPWGILISTYEFFLMMSAGTMVGVVALSLAFNVRRFDRIVKRALLLTLATLGAGLFTILIGLGRPERPMIQAVINANPSSPIWWVIMIAGTFGAVVVALFVLVETDLIESPGTIRAVGIVGFIVGLAVMVAAGMIFGTIQTRPYYGGPIAPLYFVVTGVFSGVAAVSAVLLTEYKVTGRTMDAEIEELLTDTLGKLLGVLAGGALLIALVKATYGLTSTSDSTAMAYEQMLLGSFAPLYWGVGILLGLVVPVALMAYAGTRTPNGVLAASVAALIGLFVTRYEFVVGGQVVALTGDPSHQYPLVSYVPSGIELALVVLAFAICALVYTAGSLLLELDDESTGTAETRRGAATADPRGADNE